MFQNHCVGLKFLVISTEWCVVRQVQFPSREVVDHFFLGPSSIEMSSDIPKRPAQTQMQGRPHRIITHSTPTYRLRISSCFQIHQNLFPSFIHYHRWVCKSWFHKTLFSTYKMRKADRSYKNCKGLPLTRLYLWVALSVTSLSWAAHFICLFSPLDLWVLSVFSLGPCVRPIDKGGSITPLRIIGTRKSLHLNKG